MTTGLTPKFQESVEIELAQWYEEHSFLYIKTLDLFKDKGKKNALFDSIGQRYNQSG
jgi:hypothetical protein